MNLSNFIPKTHILKLDASQIRGRLISEVIQYYHCYYLQIQCQCVDRNDKPTGHSKRKIKETLEQ